MAAMFHVAFRYSRSELASLDKLVDWERAKGPTMFPSQQANRTSVLKALVEREHMRLNEENENMMRKIEKAKENGRALLDKMQGEHETPLQRKNRLQRERRRAKRAQVA
jgi:hypothetical protein